MEIGPNFLCENFMVELGVFLSSCSIDWILLGASPNWGPLVNDYPMCRWHVVDRLLFLIYIITLMASKFLSVFPSLSSDRAHWRTGNWIAGPTPISIDSSPQPRSSVSWKVSSDLAHQSCVNPLFTVICTGEFCLQSRVNNMGCFETGLTMRPVVVWRPR